jgi:threonine dehydrogenase-like Zn-dependent dehydrogenase
MRANCWYDKEDVRVQNVPDPIILNPRDAIIKVTSTAICGSDLHLYDGFVPTMKPGDILGHEFMGEVVEVGKAVTKLKPGDRVVVPFAIACGKCFFCQKGLTSQCDNAIPEAMRVEALYGHAPAAYFGYSHLFGGYAGGQAEYVRVPFADFGPLKVPDGLEDEKVLFLTDIFPTGYQAADQADIQPGDTVAVWGCGPVGQFAIKSAYLLGAERVIAIDHVKERLMMAKEQGKAEVINFERVDVVEMLKYMTGGRGPDVCIDAVGLEPEDTHLDTIYDYAKFKIGLVTDLGHVLREAIQACRKCGTVSLPGVYAGIIDKFNLGSAFGKGLKLRMGQTQVHRYIRPLLDRIQKGEIDPSFVITHKMRLEEASKAYRMFKNYEDGCIKVILKP